MRSPRAFVRELAGNGQSEAARLFLMAAYLLLVITCYTTTKAVRDSLFLSEIGTAQLPYLYMLTAGSMALISVVYPRALRRIGLFSFARLTSVIAVASLLVFWWLVSYQGRASFYLLYVWVSLFGAITASQAWSVASHVFDAREARRTYAGIGLGGVLGGIVGGSLAGIIAPWLGTEILLPICAGLMAITVGILYRLDQTRDREASKTAPDEIRKSSGSGLTVLAQIKASPYLSMMVFLLLAGVIVEAFVDYEFKVIADQALDSKDRLTSFFGRIALYGGILALLVQTLVTRRLLKRFGVGAAILLLPSALLAGFLFVAARPALWAVSILKLIDGSLSYSVHRSGMELLYVPIPPKLRASVKGLIDLLVDRVGRAVGGLLLLVLTAGLSLSIPALSVIAAIGLAVWLMIAVLVRRDYVQAFREALEKKVIEPEALEVRDLDHTITAALLQALSSPDDRQVLYALDLLGGTHPSGWHGYLPALLEHSSAAVRSRTIALLTEWRLPSISLVTERLFDPDLEVRVEAVRHLSVMASPQTSATLKEFISHDDFRVVLAAIHCMAQYPVGGQDLIDATLIERILNTTGEHAVTARTAAARALAIARLPETTPLLERLLRDPDRQVVLQAIRTAGEIRYEPVIPLLIALLARAPFRREAREALLRLGSPALSELKNRLDDDQTPLEVRTRIPKVLSFFSSPDIAGSLLTKVHRLSPRLDMPLLKAVNRIRIQGPDIGFEEEHVWTLIREECGNHRKQDRIRSAVQTTGGEYVEEGAEKVLSLLTKALDERLDQSVEKVFRLLYLIYSPSDIRSVHFNFTSRPDLRASALEFLDNIIDPELKALVMPLVDDSPEDDSEENVEETELRLEDAIHILLTDEDDWLRTIAKELAARLKLKDVVGRRTA